MAKVDEEVVDAGGGLLVPEAEASGKGGSFVSFPPDCTDDPAALSRRSWEKVLMIANASCSVIDSEVEGSAPSGSFRSAALIMFFEIVMILLENGRRERR